MGRRCPMMTKEGDRMIVTRILARRGRQAVTQPIPRIGARAGRRHADLPFLKPRHTQIHRLTPLGANDRRLSPGLHPRAGLAGLCHPLEGLAMQAALALWPAIQR
jgi:hypothetical protein